MLDPNEKYVFDGMVSQLCADDPAFARRVDHLGRSKRRLGFTLAVLLWTMTPFLIVFGGWTGLLMAVVASGYGAHLMTKRNRPAGDAHGFSWWPSRRRPGAAL